MPILRIVNKQTRRGGARNTGRKMPSNTSGMAGIGFRFDGGTLYVCAAAGERRLQRSIKKQGPRVAIAQVIAARASYGYPVPSLRTAVAAWQRWMTKTAEIELMRMARKTTLKENR